MHAAARVDGHTLGRAELPRTASHSAPAQNQVSVARELAHVLRVGDVHEALVVDGDTLRPREGKAPGREPCPVVGELLHPPQGPVRDEDPPSGIERDPLGVDELAVAASQGSNRAQQGTVGREHHQVAVAKVAGVHETSLIHGDARRIRTCVPHVDLSGRWLGDRRSASEHQDPGERLHHASIVVVQQTPDVGRTGGAGLDPDRPLPPATEWARVDRGDSKNPYFTTTNLRVSDTVAVCKRTKYTPAATGRPRSSSPGHTSECRPAGTMRSTSVRIRRPETS